MTEPTIDFQEQEAHEAFPIVAKRDRKFLESIWYLLRRWPFVPIIVLSLLVFAALFAPLLTEYDPIHPDLLEWNTPPFWTAEGSMKHPLGTDNIGRDVFSRLVYGARISLMVVTVATISKAVTVRMRTLRSV